MPIQRINACPLDLAAHGVRLCPLHKRVDNALALVEEAFRSTTLQEVIGAFPDQLPSKRDIMKRFGITDHQAYKLYQELDELAGRLGGRLGEASEESN